MKEFEDVISDVGGHGRFQKRLLYAVLGPLFFILPFPCFLGIFAHYVPRHWCRHPDGVGEMLARWKDCFIPMEERPDGTKTHSSCKMFKGGAFHLHDDVLWSPDRHCPANASSSSSSLSFSPSAAAAATPEVVPCESWSFDTSDFSRTAVTDNGWVCEDGHLVTNAFFSATVGAIVGTIIFNTLSDVAGRKYVFWGTTLIILVFGVGQAFVSHVFATYFTFKVVTTSCILATFQVPLAIITEISDASFRAWAVGMTCVLWTVGMSLIPLVAWLARDWVLLTIISILPLGLLFLAWKLVPESPRYLLTRGRVREAEAVLSNMSRVNGNAEPKDLFQRLSSASKSMRAQKVYGYLSLFSKQRLAFKTLCLAVANVASNFIYYNLSINIGNMAGNFFLNFFALAIAEGPANFLAMWLAEKAGRRLSHSGLLLFNFACLAFNAAFARTPSMSLAVRLVCVLAKFNCTASFVVMYVQAIEIFPTSLRNTGMGFTTLVATSVGIGGPHLVALGRTHDARIPYLVMSAICLVGGVAASFLPETAGAELPETIKEADEFGRDQKFFGWVRPRNLGSREKSEGGGGGDHAPV